ncbi:MAG TPA: hypothetical protein VME67_00305 [Mycobacterium sp.]|nr:hypothetical protein [Mycobacterium sp.]HTX93391.1 hypothetical protein [Mycobacterium sp.]
MTTSPARSGGRVLAAWAALGALTVAMLGEVVLSAPRASATCNLSPQDEQYIQLLAQNGMVHNSDFTDCHEAAEGRWFAEQVRISPDPALTAKNLMTMITDTTPMNASQAEWEVESAIYVYAPEMVPKIKDEVGKQTPPNPE